VVVTPSVPNLLGAGSSGESNVPGVEDLCESQLCTGCGVCASLAPDRFEMDEPLEFGRRPFVKSGAAVATGG